MGDPDPGDPRLLAGPTLEAWDAYMNEMSRNRDKGPAFKAQAEQRLMQRTKEDRRKQGIEWERAQMNSRPPNQQLFQQEREPVSEQRREEQRRAAQLRKDEQEREEQRKVVQLRREQQVMEEERRAALLRMDEQRRAAQVRRDEQEREEQRRVVQLRREQQEREDELRDEQQRMEEELKAAQQRMEEERRAVQLRREQQEKEEQRRVAQQRREDEEELEASFVQFCLQEGGDPFLLPMECIAKWTSGFNDERVVGAGAFGTVYRGVVTSARDQKGYVLAVKKLSAEVMLQGGERHLRREINILRCLSTPLCCAPHCGVPISSSLLQLVQAPRDHSAARLLRNGRARRQLPRL